MKLKTAVTLLLISVLGYVGFGFVKVHTSSDVLTYKSFSKALVDGDRFRAKRLVLNEEVMKVFENQEKRNARFDGDIKFTYHQVISHDYSADKEEARIKVRFITRFDPEGAKPTFWGSESVDEIHHVVLRKNEDDFWRITSFSGSLVSSSV